MTLDQCYVATVVAGLQAMFFSKLIFLNAIGVLAVVASKDYECCPCSNLLDGVCANGQACGIMHTPNLCCGCPIHAILAVAIVEEAVKLRVKLAEQAVH